MPQLVIDFTDGDFEILMLRAAAEGMAPSEAIRSWMNSGLRRASIGWQGACVRDWLRGGPGLLRYGRSELAAAWTKEDGRPEVFEAGMAQLITARALSVGDHGVKWVGTAGRVSS